MLGRVAGSCDAYGFLPAVLWLECDTCRQRLRRVRRCANTGEPATRTAAAVPAEKEQADGAKETAVFSWESSSLVGWGRPGTSEIRPLRASHVTGSRPLRVRGTKVTRGRPRSQCRRCFPPRGAARPRTATRPLQRPSGIIRRGGRTLLLVRCSSQMCRDAGCHSQRGSRRRPLGSALLSMPGVDRQRQVCMTLTRLYWPLCCVPARPASQAGGPSPICKSPRAGLRASARAG